MASITPIEDTDLISESNEVINTNFTNLNDDKIETSTLDTDVTLAADSDAKIATQRAVKSYVDTTSNNKPTLTEATSTAPTINTDTYGRYVLTTQVQDITSFTTNLTGTPSDGDTLDIRITNGITATSFVASSEYGDASSDSAVIAKPSGTVDDDIMFMVIESGTAYTNALPDGWTSLAQTNSTDFYELAYKVASTEGSNYTVGFAAAQPVKVTIVTYTGGFNVTDPIDTFSNTAYVVSNTSNTAVSMDVTHANSVLLFFGAVQGTSAVTQTKPILPTTDWTEDYDGGDTDSDFWLEASSMTWTGKGATGTMTSTLSTTKTNKHAFAVALKPVVEIAWGASFNGEQDGVVLNGNSKNFNLVYNGALAKYENFETPTVPIIRKYLSSATWTKLAGLKYIEVEVIGGGGGGGGSIDTDSAPTYGVGGGSSGYAKKIIQASDLGSSETVTIGAGGAGASGTGTGTTGVASTFEIAGGTNIVSNPGAGGTRNTTSGAGGTATGGDINITGTSGTGSGENMVSRGAVHISGGNSYGAGGDSATPNNSGNATGATGKTGLVTVTEHY